MAELLIVIALIAVMVTGVGIAFRGSDASTALTSSQTTLGSLFTSAQLQATTSGRDVYVMLDINPASEGFLRQFIVFRHTPEESTVKYNMIGKPIFLPAGTFVSPDDGMDVNSNQFNWASPLDRKKTSGGSKLADFGISAGQLPPVANLPNKSRTHWYGWRIFPNGRVDSSMGEINQIVLVSGARLPNTNQTVEIKEEDSHQARGVKISYYGQVSMVDFYSLFD